MLTAVQVSHVQSSRFGGEESPGPGVEELDEGVLESTASVSI